MFKKKSAFQRQVNTYLPFVSKVMEGTRALAESDGVISLKMDNTAMTVVTFWAVWQGQITSLNPRRVFLQAKKTENDKYLLIFSPDKSGGDPVTKEYDEDQFINIPKAIMRYLRIGVINQ